MSVLRALSKVSLFLARDLDQRTFRLDAEFLAESGTHENGVVPRNLGDWVGAFLEPTVIGEATVVHRVIGDETHLEVGLGKRADRWSHAPEDLGKTATREIYRNDRIGRVGQQPVVQKTPEGLGRVAATKSGYGVENQRVAVSLG